MCLDYSYGRVAFWFECLWLCIYGVGFGDLLADACCLLILNLGWVYFGLLLRLGICYLVCFIALLVI